MDSIITYLFLYNQYLLKVISQLLLFISKNIPLKQLAFEDSRSPKYQKFKVDKLPTIIKHEVVDYQLLLAYYRHKYNKTVTPVKHKSEKTKVSEAVSCPRCGAPHEYIYNNNGSKGQCNCKVCSELFSEVKPQNRLITLRCPYCNHIFSPIKNRKHFRIHKCINSKCSYYRSNYSKIPKDLPAS